MTDGMRPVDPGNTRGSSGATVVVLSDERRTFAVKRGVGNGRVSEQGKWLLEHQRQCAPALPMVSTVDLRGDWYYMERLSPVPIHLLDTKHTLLQIADLLHDLVWVQNAEVFTLDAEAHAKRLAPIIGPLRGSDVDVFAQLFDSVDWDNVTRGLTHGDPILDNLMTRDQQLVLIDPIPATPALPDMRAVDVGRLLQSAVGYERVRYSLGGPYDTNLSDILAVAGGTSNDQLASIYFGIMHTLRSMVYVPRRIAERIYVNCTSKLLEEARWML